MLIHEASPFTLCRCGVVHRDIAAGPNPAAWRRSFRNLFLTNTMKNLMLGAIATASATNPDFGSLHTAYSTSGANEVTGGSPAYARAALTWASPSGGSVGLAATLPTWNVPASTTVRWWGGWDAVSSGNFLFMLPLGAGTLRPCSSEIAADITTNDLIVSKAHGYTAGTIVTFWGTLPTGLVVGTFYKVITTNLTADAFSLTTEGGATGDSPLNLTGTAPFNFFVQSVVPEAFTGQGTYSLTAGSIDLSAVA
jgi:hypothetical protein